MRYEYSTGRCLVLPGPRARVLSRGGGGQPKAALLIVSLTARRLTGNSHNLLVFYFYRHLWLIQYHNTCIHSARGLSFVTRGPSRAFC